MRDKYYLLDKRPSFRYKTFDFQANIFVLFWEKWSYYHLVTPFCRADHFYVTTFAETSSEFDLFEFNKNNENIDNKNIDNKNIDNKNIDSQSINN